MKTTSKNKRGRIRLIVLTGAHGTGKSHAGRVFAEQLGAPLLNDAGWYARGILAVLWYTARLFWLRYIQRAERIVVAYSYLDQLAYAGYYNCPFLYPILRRLACTQLCDKSAFFVHIPLVPAHEAVYYDSAKTRARNVEKVIVEYLSKFCDPYRCIDLPPTMHTRREVLINAVKFLKEER